MGIEAGSTAGVDRVDRVYVSLMLGVAEATMEPPAAFGDGRGCPSDRRRPRPDPALAGPAGARPRRIGPRDPGFVPSPVYRRRSPEQTPLYQVVQHHLETYLGMVEEGEADPLPVGSEHEFRRYLTCGILAFGFARAHCTDCGQERLVAFNCKARCVCPSCTNRRMAEVTAHLSDSVLPAVPVRQWVLSVPKPLRPHLMRDTDLGGAVLRCAS